MRPDDVQPNGQWSWPRKLAIGLIILIGLLLIIVSVVPRQMLQDTIPAWSLCS